MRKFVIILLLICGSATLSYTWSDKLKFESNSTVAKMILAWPCVILSKFTSLTI